MADLFNGSISLDNRYYFWTDGTIRNAAQNSGHGDIIQKDGVYETNLRDWYTEGQRAPLGNNGTGSKPASAILLIQISGFLIGIGIRKGITREITPSIEADYYYFPHRLPR